MDSEVKGWLTFAVSMGVVLLMLTIGFQAGYTHGYNGALKDCEAFGTKAMRERFPWGYGIGY